MQSIHDIASFCAARSSSSLHRGFAWYAIYFLFQAALVLEASYLQGLKLRRERRYAEEEGQEEGDDDGDDSGGEGGAFKEHSLAQARTCLRVLAETNNSAKRCAEVLDSIHGRLRSQAAAADTLGMTTGGEPLEHVVPQQPSQAGSTPVGGGHDYAMFGTGFGFADDVVDPTLRMLINPTSSDLFEDMPLDMLLDNWTA